MTYYKICRFVDNKLYSFVRECSIEYKLNEWVTPSFGKLFVLDSLENLQRFCFINTYHRIFECEVTNPTTGPMYIPHSTPHEYKCFWDGKLIGVPCHTGTVLVDALKLKKEI